MNLSIGEAARRCGLSIETIRYYEREGLIAKTDRTVSGRRTYGPEHLQTLSFIRRARDMGFTLRDTRELLAFRSAGRCEEVAAIATKHLEEVKRKLNELSELRAVLERSLQGCTMNESANCRILQTLEGCESVGPK